MSGAAAIAVHVPAEDVLAVRRFFQERGAGAGARGFYLPFITTECSLSAPRAMAAICALIELHEVEMDRGYGGANWTFWPKGGRRA
jgi:hypothetical protein